MARLTIFARLNVPAFLQSLANFLLRQMRFLRPIFRHARRFAVLGDKFCRIHVLRLPIEIGDLIFWTQEILRIPVAFQAPLHAHWLGIGDNRHVIDLPVTASAADAAVHVRSVIVEHIIGQAMNPYPLNWLTGFPARPHRLQLRIIFLHLLMTGHARLSVWHVRVGRGFHEAVAITAIHSQLGHVNVMGKRHRLNRLVTHLGIFRRYVIPSAGGQTAHDHEAANRQFKRQPIRPAGKKVRHKSTGPLPPIFSRYRIGENWCRFQISKGLRLHAAQAKVSPTLVCADSINTPLLGKKNFWSELTGIFAWNDGNSPMMRVVAAILLLIGSIASAAEMADTIFINGNIYTVNEKQPRAEAVAISGDRIAFVGSNADAQKFRSETTRVVDLSGNTVVPGLTDSHCHIFGIGEREMTLNLEGTNTLEDFLAKVKERVTKTEPGKWITGRGWIETFWKPPQFPTREELDKIAPENPVYLTRADGHASVVNSAALKFSEIDNQTPDPFGGRILRTNGELNGMLLDHAQDIVENKIPPPTQSEREQEFLTGIEREVKLGWCEIQNAGSHYDDVDLMRKHFDTGEVKIRLVNCIYGPGADAQRFLKEGATINAYDRHFTQRTIKVIFDGALGSRGAALLKPYSDRPDTSGYFREKPAELSPMFEEALRRGLQVETHAIGDRANRTILDLYESAFKAVPSKQRATSNGGASSASPPGLTKLRPPKVGVGGDARWRVEHAQILSEQDIPRFAKLGVIASMQPSHAISDLFFAPDRLGMDRLQGAYAWNSLIKSGAVICGGSDAPVERGEPMIEFYAAVARKPLPEHGLSVRAPSGVELRSDRNSGQHDRWAHRPQAYVPPQLEGWHPEQALSREQALKMFTINAAYAAFEENDKGSIEVGKLADFTVLSNDIMKIAEPEILKTRCEMTVIGGEIVFEDRH
jgi:predicted amidohydrolase YtcJ